jgi:hypothetical protein
MVLAYAIDTNSTFLFPRRAGKATTGNGRSTISAARVDHPTRRFTLAPLSNR